MDATTKYSGATPLHNAAVQGHEKVIRALVELGAKVDVEENNKITPLYEAAANGKSFTNRDSVFLHFLLDCCFLLSSKAMKRRFERLLNLVQK